MGRDGGRKGISGTGASGHRLGLGMNLMVWPAASLYLHGDEPTNESQQWQRLPAELVAGQ